jgi:hypothetical protein
MMRNNDFDALVSAKQTLRGKILRPSSSTLVIDPPPDEVFDDKYCPSKE